MEISDVARYLSAIKQLPDIRQGKVDSVRAQLADGTYQHTPEKIDAVVTGVLNEWA